MMSSKLNNTTNILSNTLFILIFTLITILIFVEPLPVLKILLLCIFIALLIYYKKFNQMKFTKDKIIKLSLLMFYGGVVIGITINELIQKILN